MSKIFFACIPVAIRIGAVWTDGVSPSYPKRLKNIFVFPHFSKGVSPTFPSKNPAACGGKARCRSTQRLGGGRGEELTLF